MRWLLAVVVVCLFCIPVWAENITDIPITVIPIETPTTEIPLIDQIVEFVLPTPEIIAQVPERQPIIDTMPKVVGDKLVFETAPHYIQIENTTVLPRDGMVDLPGEISEPGAAFYIRMTFGENEIVIRRNSR